MNKHTLIGGPPMRVLASLAALVLVVAACGPAASASPSASAPTSAEPSEAPSPSTVNITPEPISGPGPNGGTVVRWFIGLGAGTQPTQIPKEQAFATAYNGSQSDVYLSLEIVDNTQAQNILLTEIAAGNAPDIIGPVGVEGLNVFRDQLLDMAPLIASTGYTNPAGVDQSLVDFFNSLGAEGTTVGLPFAVYPSFLFYNKDLFDEAGLAYPPTEVGADYEGAPWDLEALRTLAMKLTVDSAGNDATSPDFDPDNIVQWGFDSQFQDDFNARAETSFFGAGSLLAEDGTTAVVPDYIADGEKWFNAGVWTDHFIPTKAQRDSDLLSAGWEFGSGNLAMNVGHTWFTCCVAPQQGDQFNFGFAALPTVNGKITSALHADTFSVLKTTRVPDAALKAVTAMVASADLLTTYGAMPADQAQRQTWFDAIDAGFQGQELDWDVVTAMLAYPDIPNHQSWVPEYPKVRDAMKAFGNKYRTTEGLDMDAELATLQQTLQGIFDAAQ